MQVHYKRLQYSFVGVIHPTESSGGTGFGFTVDPELGYILSTFKIEIAGVDKTSLVKLGSINGLMNLDSRDEFSFHLIDTTFTYRPPRLAIVRISHDGREVIKGIIIRQEEEVRLEEGELIRNIYVYCRGSLFSLDRRVFWGESPGGQLHGQILGSLQWNQMTTISLGDISGGIDFAPFPGPHIEKQNFTGQTAFQGIARMIRAAGENWAFWGTWQDNLPILHVRDMSTDPLDAPWDITDGDGNMIAVGKILRSDEEYANRVYIRTEFQNFSTLTTSFTADGFGRFVTLEFFPKQILSIDLDGVPQTFGIISEDLNGDPPDESFDWYYQPLGVGDFVSHNVEAGPNTPTPTAGQVLTVTYQAQTGNNLVKEDTSEQATIAANMGFGSGRFDMVAEHRNVKDQASAEELAEGILARAKQQVISFPYRTWRGGIFPGQVQNIVFAKGDINGEYLVSSVRFYESADGFKKLPRGLEYEVKVSSVRQALPYVGKYVEDLVDVARGGSDPVTLLTESASGGGVLWTATMLYVGEAATPEVPITGDAQHYDVYIDLPGGGYISLDRVRPFARVAPGSVSLIGDIRYIDPNGNDTGSIFAAGSWTLGVGETETLITTFRSQLILEDGGRLVGDLDQTDSAARRLGITIVGRRN